MYLLVNLLHPSLLRSSHNSAPKKLLTKRLVGLLEMRFISKKITLALMRPEIPNRIGCIYSQRRHMTSAIVPFHSNILDILLCVMQKCSTFRHSRLTALLFSASSHSDFVYFVLFKWYLRVAFKCSSWIGKNVRSQLTMLSFDAGREVGIFNGLTGKNWESLWRIKWVGGLCIKD